MMGQERRRYPVGIVDMERDSRAYGKEGKVRGRGYQDSVRRPRDPGGVDVECAAHRATGWQNDINPSYYASTKHP